MQRYLVGFELDQYRVMFHKIPIGCTVLWFLLVIVYFSFSTPFQIISST